MTRRAVAVMTILGVSAVAGSVLFKPAPRLIWNASASVAIGLYAVRPAGRVVCGSLVVVAPPTPLAEFLAARDYLPRGVPLIKRVAAEPGQIVCRDGFTISVDGAAIGDALPRDRLGRPLPVWQGCRRIADGELFLMNHTVGDSFDGRYTGPTSRQFLIGLAIPLWIDARGDGDFRWPAAVPKPASIPHIRSLPCP